jgi:general secretion pathway protein B
MSYILDALKKADQERAAGNVPDLETVHRHEPTVRRHYRWLWILAALLIFNGVMVALLATRHDAGLGGDTPGHQLASTDRGSVLTDTARSRPPTESAPVVRKSPSRIVKSVPQVQDRPQVVEARPVSPRVQPEAASQDRSAAPAVAAATPAPAPVSVVMPPPTPTAGTADERGNIPEWDDLSLDFRSSLPMPRVDVHVYDTDPQRRFVLIDLQKYREGDRLPNGAVIEKILPDGMQMSYQGTRFHYTK